MLVIDDATHLVLPLPGSWAAQVAARQPPEIRLSVPGSLSGHVTVIVPDGEEAAPPSIDLKTTVEAIAERTISGRESVEQKLPLMPLRGSDVNGYYFTFEPANQESSGHVTRGMATCGQLRLVFTLASNHERSTSLALKALAEASCSRRQRAQSNR